MNKYKKIFAVLILVVSLILLSKLPLSEYLNSLISWFRGFGMWAPFIYFIFFSLTSSLIFPVFMLSIGAGILFGVGQGALIVSSGNLVSCVIMFLLARYKGRDWFEEKVLKYKTLSGISRAIEGEGWKMLFMLRAVPVVHMILLNITCGLSKLRMKDYILGTWLGMLPMLVVYVYMGSLTKTVISSPTSFDFSGNQSILLVLSAVVVLGVFTFYIKKMINKYIVPVTAQQ